ncbi:MAG: type II toxin-antitoxin system PemK/MazF family toxin [Polyangia bacterium]|nr:type II toxin-antitoxin system PemK/MazF family toxin [Polyangia bacterium]
MSVSQGDVWWVELGEPRGSGPGYRRPVVVVQGDGFNRSAIRTVVVIPLTSNLRWAAAPGNLELRPRDSGLPLPSVANVSQIIALDRDTLVERVGKLPRAKLDLVLRGIDRVLGQDG